MKYAIIIVYSIVALKGVFAMEYEKASIALVTNFLVRIEMDKPLSFDEEEHFFDRSLVGASLYIQYGYMCAFTSPQNHSFSSSLVNHSSNRFTASVSIFTYVICTPIRSSSCCSA